MFNKTGYTRTQKIARHRVKIVNGDIFSNIDKIIQDIKNNAKVLVVCNTVNNAQRVYNVLKNYTDRKACCILGLL